MVQRYTEVDEPRASLLACFVQDNPTLFDIQTSSAMYAMARTPVEDNQEVAPLMDGSQKLNVAMTCRGVEIFNIVLSDCIEQADRILTRPDTQLKKELKKYESERDKALEQFVHTTSQLRVIDDIIYRMMFLPASHLFSLEADHPEWDLF